MLAAEPRNGLPLGTFQTYLGHIGEHDGFVEPVPEKSYNFILVLPDQTLDALTLTVPEIIELVRDAYPGEWVKDFHLSPHGAEFQALILAAIRAGEIDLCDYYRSQIETWNWDGIVREASADPDAAVYLGSVAALVPSGKTDVDALLDEAWNSALDAIAEEKGGYVTSGEGDGCDLFFGV